MKAADRAGASALKNEDPFREKHTELRGCGCCQERGPFTATGARPAYSSSSPNGSLIAPASTPWRGVYAMLPPCMYSSGRGSPRLNFRRLAGAHARQLSGSAHPTRLLAARTSRTEKRREAAREALSGEKRPRLLTWTCTASRASSAPSACPWLQNSSFSIHNSSF